MGKYDPDYEYVNNKKSFEISISGLMYYQD